MLKVTNLIGFGGKRSNPALHVEYKTVATSSAQTVAWPSVASGDLAVLLDWAYHFGASAPTAVTPSGFTVHLNQTASLAGILHQRLMVSSKICTGSESGNLTGMNSSGTISKVMLIFGNGIASRTSSTWQYSLTDGNPASKTASASGGNAPLVVIGCAITDTIAAAWTTESPAFDDEVTANGGRMLVGYKVYNSSPNDHTIDMNDLGSMNAIAIGYLEVA